MPKNSRYHPNYSKNYPEVNICQTVMQALKTSDRKIEYVEYELKHTRVRRDQGDSLSITPPRETSLEGLLEQDRQFTSSSPSPEDVFFALEDRHELRDCIATLTNLEQALLRALYWDRLTEREYATKLGISQKAVNKRKKRILHKLRKKLHNKGTQIARSAE